MPLQKSASKRAARQNIRTLIREGKPRNQAIAIALSIQGREKDKVKRRASR